MKIIFNIFTFFLFTMPLYADDHSNEQSFPGLVSSEVFNMGNGMDMHVERRKHAAREQWQSIFILLLVHWFMF